MKPHKHAELIKAWADGAEIEWREDEWSIWRTKSYPTWEPYLQYRVKPEVKPDGISYGFIHYRERHIIWTEHQTEEDNIKFTFDGETGKLKSAEIIG